MSDPSAADPSPAAYPDTYGIHPTTYHRRKLILAILCLSLVVIVIAVSSVNVALPRLASDLGATAEDLQWIVDSYALVFAGLLLPAGALGDRFGRKRALLVGLAIFGVCSLWASQAGSPGELIAARAVMGVGAAFIMPATLSIITHSFPPHERTKAVATWAGLAGAGGAIGPVVSGLMLEHYWWGSIFFVSLPIVVALMLLTVGFVPSSKDSEEAPLDPVGAVLSVAGLTALVFAVIEGPEWGWLSVGVIGTFAAAVALLVGFVGWELRIDHPTLDPRLFKIPGFSMGTATIALGFFAMFGMFFLVTQYLQFVLGDSPLQAGYKTLPGPAMMILISPRSPAIVGRFGIRNVTRAGFALMAAGSLGLAFLETTSGYPAFVVPLMAVAAGFALVMAPATSTIVGSLPLAKAGVGSAVNDVSREVGAAIGIAVQGSLMNSSYRSAIDLDAVEARVPDVAAAQFSEAVDAASESIGAAQGVAGALETCSAPGMEALAANCDDIPLFGELAAGIRQSAGVAFVSGMGTAFVTAAVVLIVVGVATVARFIPDELPPEELAGGAPDGGATA